MEAVIGLEVHTQLLTQTKLFCGCPTRFGSKPNSNVCPVCLGHPGVLPVLNQQAVVYALMMGVATNCTINRRSVFARKNYFYPDLPKGFQTSQYDLPLCEHGYVDVDLKDGSRKRIGITRIHIEEDAGKSVHDADELSTCIDANRCGVPLIEIVSEPDIRSPEEAHAYMVKIRQLVQYLGICDGNMEEGSLRCDANVSIRPIGETAFGTKTEIKNMNSFRNVERAIAHEITRQCSIVEDGGSIVQQTLLWNADLATVMPMRGKEEAHDYRYFPEPDLMPVAVDDAMIDAARALLPELPEVRKRRFCVAYGLPEYDAAILTQTRSMADYYEATVRETTDFKAASNWVMGEVLKVLHERKTEFTAFPIPPDHLGAMINRITEGTLSTTLAKDVFAAMLAGGGHPDAIIREQGLTQLNDEGELSTVISSIVQHYPMQVAEYRGGSQKIFGFFMGQVMKQTRGKANPALVTRLLEKILMNK